MIEQYMTKTYSVGECLLDNVIKCVANGLGIEPIDFDDLEITHSRAITIDILF